MLFHTLVRVLLAGLAAVSVVAAAQRPSPSVKPGAEANPQKLWQVLTGAADRDRGRLLYAISEDGRWPTLWYLDNGHSRLKYNPREENIELRFRGSKFVPRVGPTARTVSRN